MTQTAEPRTEPETHRCPASTGTSGSSRRAPPSRAKCGAGFTTWLTMSYILFVNPQVLLSAIPVPNAFVQLLMATCLAAAFGSLVMGIVARYPFAQAPGMGLNAFFAFTVVGAMGYPWQTAWGRCSSPGCCSWSSA